MTTQGLNHCQTISTQQKTPPKRSQMFYNGETLESIEVDMYLYQPATMRVQTLDSYTA